MGSSPAMQEVLWRIAKVAEADTNLCLYGESGTGKELVARAIHYAGPRADHPLIVLDCAAIPKGSWRARCSATSRAPSPRP